MTSNHKDEKERRREEKGKMIKWSDIGLREWY